MTARAFGLLDARFQGAITAAETDELAALLAEFAQVTAISARASELVAMVPDDDPVAIAAVNPAEGWG